ncbi:glycosyltransferase [Priestia megaterium]|uniref:glycosyltransferase n=1 Tax=Priestia megaterium TaxID=1404 RepID=UPI0021D66CCB|nr:glycosyltransferase [Priestia megaterium]MCU7713031.1 glycosyltransferase [Priestia megaterium]
MNNKKVCMLVTEHPFLDARIFKKEAKSLVKKGYDVTMIVPRRNGYLFDVNSQPFTDKFLKQTFIHEGVIIKTYDISKRTFNPLTDPLFHLGVAEEADIYHAHEFYSLHYGAEIKRFLREKKKKDVKLIYDSHEIDPDPFTTTDDIFQRKYKMLVNMLKEVNHVITVSESIKAWFLTIDPTLPVEVIYNSPPLANNFITRGKNKQKLTICHEGNVSDKTGNLTKMCKITEICNASMNLNFKIIGGVLHGNSFTVPPTISNKVIMTGWVDYHSIPNEMADVDLGWIDRDSSKSLNFMYAMPNKFFSYLNNGIPVLVNKSSDMEYFVRTFRCGIVVNKLNATASDYAEALLYANSNRNKLMQMSINARKVMEELFNWNEMEKRLFDVYESLSSTNIKYFI